MKSYRRSLVACAAFALMLLLPASSVMAGQGGGGRDKDRDKDKKSDHRPVEFTYTKWITTAPLPAPLPWQMKGFVNDGAVGSFLGEVLDRKVSTNGKITKLEAIYEVVDGEHSFTALVQGGQDNLLSLARLDGVVLAGWRTGARVHVEFQALNNCGGVVPMGKCFQGTIRVGREPGR